MNNNFRLSIYIVLIALFYSCSTGKFIPENKYLLEEVKIVSDTEEVEPSMFSSYIRQNPNAKWFNLLKVPMGIYCLSGQDSLKGFNRFLRELGDAPVIYNPDIAHKTQIEMEKAVRNMGYMRARVHLDTQIKKNKLKLTYRIEAGRPYTVNHIAYDIDDLLISDIIEKDSLKSHLQKGMIFDVIELDKERQRITQLLQNNGYYRFNKDFLVYQADTVRNTYGVGLILKLLPYQLRKEDAPTKHKQYTVRNVNFVTGESMLQMNRTFNGYDSLYHKGLHIYFKDRSFLRPNTLANFNHIQPGKLYNAQHVQNTYTSMGRLRAIKYTNINFDEIAEEDSTRLDVYVMLTKGKNQSLSFEIEGTNSAGDLGAAASATFQHRNLFRGSETFTIKARAAFEAITGLQEGYESNDYQEYGIEASLNFPEFKFPFLSSEFKRKIRATSEVGANFNSQHRPEFVRTLASASWSYRWVDRKRSQHRFDLVDINYIYVPWKSNYFQEYLDNLSSRNSILTKSYEDQLIVRMGYSYTYNSSNDRSKSLIGRNSYSIRLNIEEAGNILYAASKAVHTTPKQDKGYVIANIPFAQYVKGDIDFSHNWSINNNNSIVFHIGLGVAYPYGNSQILPFEKRYFAGGPNSVRGWSVRSLGPGSYQSANDNISYINHTGDIKLLMNLEYRTHLFWKLNGAAFIDAGNIWNIRNYEGQEEGTFRFNRFFKQLAAAYGLGIRLDLDYLIIRFDGGMKAVNPMKNGKGKYPLISPNFGRDFAFHFAVGYPF